MLMIDSMFNEGGTDDTCHVHIFLSLMRTCSISLLCVWRCCLDWFHVCWSLAFFDLTVFNDDRNLKCVKWRQRWPLQWHAICGPTHEKTLAYQQQLSVVSAGVWPQLGFFFWCSGHEIKLTMLKSYRAAEGAHSRPLKHWTMKMWMLMSHRHQLQENNWLWPDFIEPVQSQELSNLIHSISDLGH